MQYLFAIKLYLGTNHELIENKSYFSEANLCIENLFLICHLDTRRKRENYSNK